MRFLVVVSRTDTICKSLSSNLVKRSASLVRLLPIVSYMVKLLPIVPYMVRLLPYLVRLLPVVPYMVKLLPIVPYLVRLLPVVPYMVFGVIVPSKTLNSVGLFLTNML